MLKKDINLEGYESVLFCYLLSLFANHELDECLGTFRGFAEGIEVELACQLIASVFYGLGCGLDFVQGYSADCTILGIRESQISYSLIAAGYRCPA